MLCCHRPILLQFFCCNSCARRIRCGHSVFFLVAGARSAMPADGAAGAYMLVTAIAYTNCKPASPGPSTDPTSVFSIRTVRTLPPIKTSLIVATMLLVIAMTSLALKITIATAMRTSLTASLFTPPHNQSFPLLRKRLMIEAAECCAPFVLHSHGFIRQVRKLHAFRYAEQHARTRSLLGLRSAADFPSWTSRVRSPSPAFSFKQLRAFVFCQYSIYSVKEVVRPSRTAAIIAESRTDFLGNTPFTN